MDAPPDQQLHQKVDDLSRQLSEVNDRLERIEGLLDTLTKGVEGVQSSAQNMDEHINFVNGVYQQVHRPFHALIGAANRFIQPLAVGVENIEQTTGRLRLESNTDDTD